MAPERPPDIWSVEEVAERTGRTAAAIARALTQGRIARADVPMSRGSIPVRRVRATLQELNEWRVRELGEVLRARPELPQDLQGWFSQAQVARRLGASQCRARRLLQALDPPSLKWSGYPWRAEVRYWVPSVKPLRT